MTITAAADGSSLGNPGPSGWAWYIDARQWAAGGFPHGTNNIGELTAVAELLDATAHVDEPLVILCDSKYVIDSCTKWMRGWKYNGWKKKDGKPVQNVELMQRLDAALKGRRVTFEWVKGHAGHPENEAADERARAVAEAYSRGREPESVLLGPGFGGGAAERGGAEADERAADGEAGWSRAEAIAEAAADAAELDARGPGAVPLWEEDGPVEVDDAAAVVLRLERSFLDPEVRADPARLEALLHDEAEYVGVGGRRLDRAALIAALMASPSSRPRYAVEPTATRIAPGVQLVRGEEELGARRTSHSSLWVFEATGPGDGRWQVRWHQVTLVD